MFHQANVNCGSEPPCPARTRYLTSMVLKIKAKQPTKREENVPRLAWFGMSGVKSELLQCVRHPQNHNFTVWYSWWSPVTARSKLGESICRSGIPKALQSAHTHGTLLHYYWNASEHSQPATTVSVGWSWLMWSHAGKVIRQNQQTPLLPPHPPLTSHDGEDEWSAAQKCVMTEHPLQVRPQWCGPISASLAWRYLNIRFSALF